MNLVKRFTLTYVIVPIFALTSLKLMAQQPHVHGKGTLFVVQDNNAWQLQFTLPAADIFGFEHTPESKQQKALVKNRAAELKDVNNLILIPANCKLIDHQVELPDDFVIADNHDHDDHHKHDDHHDHDKHHDDHHKGDHKGHEHGDGHAHEGEHADHSDVEIVSTLDCAQVFSQIDLPIFKTFSSLNSVEVQWALNAGQGKSEVSSTNSMVTFR